MGDVVKIDKNIGLKSSGSSSVFTGTLNRVSRLINDMNTTMEERFTSMGLKIQEYSRRASTITDSALIASGTISGDDLKSAIEGLEVMVKQLEDIFSRVVTFSDSNLESLKSIGCAVRAVEKELSGLGDTSRDLKMLALSTKIQSTRTGGGSSAFMQLGEDIAGMSVIISSKAEDLQGKTILLTDFVQGVETTFQNIQEKQRYQTESVLKWTRNILGSLSDLSVDSGREAQKIRNSTEKISQGVSDMVVSLQYQDITKQSFEKVIEGLKLIGKPLSNATFENDFHSELITVPAQVQVTGQCLKQIHRLEKTDDLVQEALGVMARSLKTISLNINELTGVTSVVSRQCSKFLGDLETAMSSVTSFLKELVQSNRDISESIDSLSQTVEGMTRFTQDIEMISSEVELISLNASIMAAQAGIDGAGMGVIANAVKGTAVQSDVQRNSVVKSLNEISGISLHLNSKMKNATKDDERQLDQLVRELGVFLDAMSAMQKKNVSMLSDINSHSIDLIKVMRSSIGEIEDHFPIKSEAAGITEDMEKLALECCSLIDPADLLSIADGQFREEDLRSMGQHHRLKLVDSFFAEHCPDSFFPEPESGIASEDEAVIF